jgi:ABC-type sugar transport system substrate-binding protein
MQKPAANRWRRSASKAASEEIAMKSVFAALLGALLLGAGFACAQDSAEDTGGLPHLSEIMVAQQMRHIKLWFAGDAGNWPLADYELDQLKDGFDDVAKLLGGDLAQQHVGGAISQLEKAIESKDHAAFVSAFDQLSAGCNACHGTLDHAFIVIQRPNLLPYSDQNFSSQQ